MKVLVCGGAGFIGRSLVNDLLGSGNAVRVLDKNTEPLASISNPALELVAGNIEDTGLVQQVIKGVDVVYHLADTFSSRTDELLNIDVRGTANLLEAAYSNGVKQFLFTSTHRVYGKPRYLPVDEDHPLHPEESGRAIHSVFKLANEKLCLAYWQEQHLPVTILRFWWSFGDEIGGRAMRTLVDAALQGKPILIPAGAGGNLLHNDDAAVAFRLATLHEAAYGEVFNVSSGTFTPWPEFARIAIELTGSSSRLELIPEADWRHSLIGNDKSAAYDCDLDISKIKQRLGYQPKYTATEIQNLLRSAINRLVAVRKKKQ